MPSAAALPGNVLRCLLLALLVPALAYAGNLPDAAALVKRMEAAYARVNDYRMRVEIRIFRDDGSFRKKDILYTFKKPKSIRLDLKEPHPGMIVVYPDEEGKAVVQPPGVARFLKLHLATDSSLLVEPPGQRIDQTDLGLLIRHISHSVSDQRRGEPEISEENGRIRIQVTAADHFRAGVVTRYVFWIDEQTWLPAGVEESTPDGRLERTISFKNLETNIGVPDTFFRLD